MDGLSLGGVESAALTQGIAFLYAQAGEVLKRWRAAKDKAAEENTGRPAEMPALDAPAVFVPSEQVAPGAGLNAVGQLADALREARRGVQGYLASELADGDDAAGLAAADRLRCLLEELYGTRLTFREEQRDGEAGPATQVNAAQIGVLLSDGARVYGDVAGHTIYKK